MYLAKVLGYAGIFLGRVLKMLKILGGLILVAAIGIGLYLRSLDSVLKTPLSVEDKYWGPDISKIDDTAIKPFTIAISDKDLQRFNAKLLNHEPFESPLEGIAFEYGTNTHFLQNLVEYWQSSYDWRKREKFLNQFPQYTTQISGLDIHFIWSKPDKKTIPADTKVYPLLLLHGWPGAVRELYDVIPLLTKPGEGNFTFEVIAPSLPGFGFSQGPSKPGMGTVQIALLMKKLMERLGFQEFFVQGGDWGSEIGKKLAILAPQSVLGYHSNMCTSFAEKSHLKMTLATLAPFLFANNERESEMLKSQAMFWLKEYGYVLTQSTKPDTLGIALKDSPVGLAAYLLEKYSIGTNREWVKRIDGGLTTYDKDTLLDIIMIYWFSGSITTSMRIYRETYYPEDLKNKDYERQIRVPAACARFPNEVVFTPTSVLKDIFKNLIRVTDFPEGGHFAPLEVPSLLAKDVFDFATAAEEMKTQKKTKEPVLPVPPTQTSEAPKPTTTPPPKTTATPAPKTLRRNKQCCPQFLNILFNKTSSRVLLNSLVRCSR